MGMYTKPSFHALCRSVITDFRSFEFSLLRPMNLVHSFSTTNDRKNDDEKNAEAYRNGYANKKRYSPALPPGRLSRGMLLDRVRKAEMRRKEYRNFLNRRRDEAKELTGRSKSKYADTPTPPSHWRMVALKLVYAGWIDTDGGLDRISADNSDNSVSPSTPLSSAVSRVEHALARTRLIDDAASSRFLFHGTLAALDSASSSPSSSRRQIIGELGGIVTALVRTNLSSGIGVQLNPAKSTPALGKLSIAPQPPELPFARIINDALPDGIRVVAWAPLPASIAEIPEVPASSTTTASFFIPKGSIGDRVVMRSRACQLAKVRDGVVEDEERETSTGSDYREDNPEVEELRVKFEYKNVRLADMMAFGEEVVRVSASEQHSDSWDATAFPVSPPYVLLHSDRFDRLHWHNDIDALIDVALHFQRQRTEWAIKAAIVRQAIENVDGLLRSDEKSPELVVDGSSAGDRWRLGNILKRRYRSPLDEVMTPLSASYLLKNHSSYVDYANKRRERRLRRE